MRRAALSLLTMLFFTGVNAQPARTFILGHGTASWESGGRGIDPKIIVHAALLDTTNAPGNAIEFARRPGWISALFFDEDENIAGRVLAAGSISSPNAGRGYEEQLKGIVNGSHLTAFERKPTVFEPEIEARGIRIILDFGTPVGVHRVRFYPRNTVVSTPSAPYQDEFMRGYELWINPARTSLASPDVLIERNTANQEPIVDIQVPPQYVRILTLKSLANVPFEIDEIEVYGTGYLQRGTYLSDLLDLGDRATVGPIRWVEQAVGDPAFSQLSVRVRTGHDDTPVLYRRLLPRVGTGPRPSKEVSPQEYFALDRVDRERLEEDTGNWSPWKPMANGQLVTAPSPCRYVQFRIDFEGGLFASRELDRLEFDYLQPPIADTLVAEIYPRLAQAERPATFRYAVRLGRAGPIRGFDRLEVDTSVEVEEIRQVKLDGQPLEFTVDFVRPDAFGISFPRIADHGALLEFTFSLPIFRFGSTFSGRAYDSRASDVPQALEPGNAVRFGPGDEDGLAGLAVAIPKPQIGKLVGEIEIGTRVITPNGDGINDALELFFNVLQITRDTPVRFELYDLASRRVRTLFAEERGIGPVRLAWDGSLDDGSRILPGIYVWVLRVRADAFEETHAGTIGVVY